MNKRRLVGIALAAVLVAFTAPTTAEAQVFTPTFMAPRSDPGIGIYLSNFYDLTAEGIYRGNFGGFDLGFRGGIVDAGDASLTLGGELRNPLELGTAPLDLAFTAGVQGILGDVDQLGLQAGLGIGYTFVPAGGGFRLIPYIQPRIGLVDGPGPGDDLELELLADLGFDVAFRNGLSIRFGANLGEGADWGIGLNWR